MQNTTQKSIHPVRNRFNQTGNNTSNSEGRENIKASTRLSPFHSIPKSSREPGTTKSSISSEANQERFFPLVSAEIYIGRKKNPLWSAFFSSFQRATLPNWTLLRKKKNSKLPFFFSVSSRPREMNKWNWNLPADPRQQQQKKRGWLKVDFKLATTCDDDDRNVRSGFNFRGGHRNAIRGWPRQRSVNWRTAARSISLIVGGGGGLVGWFKSKDDLSLETFLAGLLVEEIKLGCGTVFGIQDCFRLKFEYFVKFWQFLIKHILSEHRAILNLVIWKKTKIVAR